MFAICMPISMVAVTGIVGAEVNSAQTICQGRQSLRWERKRSTDGPRVVLAAGIDRVPAVSQKPLGSVPAVKHFRRR